MKRGWQLASLFSFLEVKAQLHEWLFTQKFYTLGVN
jgi:hypothetical protein